MRIMKLIELMEQAGHDAYITTREANIFYLTGTTSGGILVTFSDSKPTLLVPRLNLSLAEDQVKEVDVKSYTREEMIEELTKLCREGSPQDIGFDDLSLQSYQLLSKKLKCDLRLDPAIIWGMRKVKDDHEQEMMKIASKITDTAMETVREILSDGLREYEIAAKAAYTMRMEGGEDHAFPLTVASGPRSAYPHAGVSHRRIRSGDLVTVDMGVKYHQYCTDLTRTFIVGSISEKQRDLYETVLEAQRSAFPKIGVDAKVSEVDRIARDIIQRSGFGRYFTHSLGHGVGLEVHEPPYLSKTSKDVLEKGNIITNEPGIYIPGFGGVRVEDTVLVSDSGSISLTNFDRDLESIKV